VALRTNGPSPGEPCLKLKHVRRRATIQKIHNIADLLDFPAFVQVA
jgi:hypothetical protein